MTTLYSPPACRECGTVLDHVDETEWNVYRFDPETGRYDEDGTINVDCPYCGADLRDTPEFEDGACNYQAERSQS